MNYIYDILINFNENLYDFYDWNLNDDISHIRKIPVFKVDSDVLFDIKNSETFLDEEFLKKIENKTEIFTNKHIKKLKYSCLFTDGMEVIAINVEKDKLLKSKLLIDEETEVIDFSDRLEKEKLNYKIISKKNINLYKTRKEIEMENYVKKQIKNLFEEDDINKLSYLYYECFDKKELDKEKIIDEFKLNLDDLIEKLYNFFKLLQFNK